MFEILLAVVTLLYLFEAVLLWLGVSRPLDETGSHSPFISVIIAARDEENSLPQCLQSVTDQTYTQNNYEIIVVNDHSKDSTEAVCQEFGRRNPNVRSFSATDDPVLWGKTNALAQGIEKARGEVILITDADCVVPRTWIEHTAKRYSADVGLVGGMTLQKAESVFQGMQSLDWAYLLGLASAAASLGTPLGSIGNNLSFRKAAYEAVGGYRTLKFSVTEDYTLVQAIIKTKKWKYLYPIDRNLLVESRPCPDVSTLLRQKHRWGTGGLDMKLAGFLIMVVGFAAHASVVVCLVLGKFIVGGFALMVRWIADYVFLRKVLVRLQRLDQLRYFVWFELYYLVYVLILPFLVFFGGKVVWKGRSY